MFSMAIHPQRSVPQAAPIITRDGAGAGVVVHF
jgi:hypothetical protein